MSQAQLRMSRLSDEPLQSAEDLFAAALAADLGTTQDFSMRACIDTRTFLLLALLTLVVDQISHGDEIDQLDRMMNELIDTHQTDADNQKMAIALESAQVMSTHQVLT